MSLDSTFDLVQFLMKAPRTATELVELTGMHRGSVDRHLQALRRNGLTYVMDKKPTGRMPENVWAWETIPFEHAGTPS